MVTGECSCCFKFRWPWIFFASALDLEWRWVCLLVQYSWIRTFRKIAYLSCWSKCSTKLTTTTGIRMRQTSFQEQMWQSRKRRTSCSSLTQQPAIANATRPSASKQTTFTKEQSVQNIPYIIHGYKHQHHSCPKNSRLNSSHQSGPPTWSLISNVTSFHILVQPGICIASELKQREKSISRTFVSSQMRPFDNPHQEWKISGKNHTMTLDRLTRVSYCRAQMRWGNWQTKNRVTQEPILPRDRTT